MSGKSRCNRETAGFNESGSGFIKSDLSPRRVWPQPKQRIPGWCSRFITHPLLILGALLINIILISLLFNALFGEETEARSWNRATIQTQANSSSAGADASVQTDNSESSNPDDPGVFSRVFGENGKKSDGGWVNQACTLAARLALAALLAGMLAFRPHKFLHILHRNPFVAQTQILLAVVAAALMMTVGDNAARAFGIFAAVSLVRFRTNIRDPKEITVLLISLGIGLAAGVGRWELAIIFTLFVLLLLGVLEHYESTQVFRAMELKIRTRDVDATDHALRNVFEKNDLEVEVRGLEREDELHPHGKVVYLMDLSQDVSTDRLAEEMLSADPDKIDRIEWHQKKASSYIYR